MIRLRSILGSLAFLAASTWLAAAPVEEGLTEAWLQAETSRTIAALKPQLDAASSSDSAALLDRQPVVKGMVLHDSWFHEFRRSPGRDIWTWRRAPIDGVVSGKPHWENLATFYLGADGSRLSSPVCFQQRCLVTLPYTSDKAKVWREFDLVRRKPVENGFIFPSQEVAKALWQDGGTLLIKTTNNAAGGEAVRRWSRGQALTAADVLMQAKAGDWLSIDGYYDGIGAPLLLITRQTEKEARAQYARMKIYQGGPLGTEWTRWQVPKTGELAPAPVLTDAWISGMHKGEIIFMRTLYGGGGLRPRPGLETDARQWKVGGKLWPSNAVLSIPVSELSSAAPAVRVVAAPRPGQATHKGAFMTRDCVVVRTNEYTRPHLRCYRFVSGQWTGGSEIAFPVEYTFTGAQSLSDPASSIAMTSYENAVQPETPFVVDTAKGRTIELSQYRKIPVDDPGKYVMQRFDATSRDGTKVPYFVSRAKNTALDGRNPTVMWFFGGWGVPKMPNYDASGCPVALWLQRGGVCVVAAIRGGTEMGLDWYVRGPQRRLSHDDVIAVAEDLVRRKVTSSKHLGLFGHDQFGTLASAVVVRERPDLFNAMFFEGGILDTLDPAIRDDYEMGSLDVPAERAYLESISPVQNLRAGERDWPVLLLPSSPGMTYRYVMRSKELGLPYYLMDDTGDIDQMALIYAYFSQRLMHK